jgi:hypothetical protein
MRALVFRRDSVRREHPMGSAARRTLIVLTLLLCALVPALSGPAAQAAPPEVLASENPAIIGWGQTTKTIELTWFLEPGLSLATLTVTESGTPPPVLVQTVSSPPGTGTVSLTVTEGKTYTAQLSTPITGQPLGAPLTITTERPPPPKFDFGCALQCITTADVVPHGLWAQFTIETSETAIITLEASTTKPNDDGKWSNPSAVMSSNATILPTKKWTPPLANLDSNTTYHYVVRAHDTNGNEQFKTGTFKTLTRRVLVTFAEIQMIDDSDGALAGDCDCFFYFNAGSVTPTEWGTLSDPQSIESGTSVHPNIAITVDGAPGEIRIRTMGHDDDTDFGEFCSAGTGFPTYTGAANWQSSGNFEECLEWAGDQVLVSVARRGSDLEPGDVNEEFTEPFTIPVNGELVYNVHGTYQVTYA